MPEPRLGYVKIAAVGPGAFAGGLMVVDSRGLPLDFKYTEPVTPSKLQAVLYGKALDKHVRQDVIFKHLVDRLDPRPDVLLVDDEALAGLLAAVPVLFLVETRIPPLREASALQAAAEGEYLLQVSETGSPLRFRVPKGEAPERYAELLVSVARMGLDPVEPFQRVRGALDLVSAEAAGET